MRSSRPIAALAIFAFAANSLAQTASTNAPVASETNSVARLPIVTVTAQKEPALSQAIPVSVTPVTLETLKDADVREVNDAAIYAPNVFINEFTARKLSNPYFRGIGSSPNNPGVTTYIDGVPQLNANSSNIELVDVDQVEFVRGPQGALFGRNTVGGLININSLRPSRIWRGDVQTEYGNYKYTDTRASVSGPVFQDQASMSLAGGYSARDGYTQNDFTGNDLDSREAFFGKGQLLWTPSEAWEARFIMSGEHDNDGDYALADLNAIRTNPHHVSRDFEGFTHRDIVAPTLVLSRYGTAVDFSMTSGLVWWKTVDQTDLDYTIMPLVTRNNSEKDVQFTEEVRFASSKDAPVNLSDDFKLKWQSGLFFFTQNYDQDAVNSFSPGVLSPTLPFPIDQHSTAALDDIGVGAFAQTTVTAYEKLDLSVGLRGDYENKKADLASFYSAPIAPLRRQSPDRDFTEVTPQFGVGYHLTPEKLVYGTVSRGYKSGGFNPSAPIGKETYNQEHSWNYETGVKTLWLDNRLSANFDVFYINWEGLQLNQPSGAPGQYYIGNAGSADSKGVEFELNARPLSGWDIFAGVGFTDARFLNGATAAQTSALGVDSTVDVANRHLIYTPDYTAHGGMQYSWQACKQATLYARGEVVAYGNYYYNAANTASQDAYTLANFRAGVRGTHWFAEGWVRNAFDTEYVPVAFEFPNGAMGGSGFVGESGAPVTFGVRAGLMF